MQRNPKDERRHVVAVDANDNVLRPFTDPGWPRPLALFTPDVQRRIMNTTGAAPTKLREPTLFWNDASHHCWQYAIDFQVQLERRPSAKDVRTARAAAVRLQNALVPFFTQFVDDEEHLNFEYVLDGHLATFIGRIDRSYRPLKAKPKRWASFVFIGRMMQLFTDAFDYEASEAPDGHFARFVIACCEETQGLPEVMTGELVQKHVKAHNKLRHLSRRKASDDPA